MRKKKASIRDLTCEMIDLIGKQSPRRLAGYWSTRELASMIGVTRSAIILQVRRGNLSPIEARHGQEHLFSDVEVYRYLATKRRPGRPKKVN